MRMLGTVLLLIGLGLFAWGFVMDVTLEVPGTSSLDGLPYGPGSDRVNNLGKLFNALKVMLAGGFLAVIGAVVLVAPAPVSEGESHKPTPSLDVPDPAVGTTTRAAMAAGAAANRRGMAPAATDVGFDRKSQLIGLIGLLACAAIALLIWISTT